jgi:hypothetical protein
MDYAEKSLIQSQADKTAIRKGLTIACEFGTLGALPAVKISVNTEAKVFIRYEDAKGYLNSL